MRKLLLAALASAATELSGLGLLATATWLIARAAQRPEIVALSVAVVAVRALAIAKGTMRYVERLAGHDAALRVLARLRTRVYEVLSRDPGRLPRGDLLARLVSDVDSVQDLLLRCAIPAGVAVIVGLVTVGFTAGFGIGAALVLAAGLVVAGLALPALAFALAARAAGRIAQVRGEYLASSVDVLAGAADLAAFGATDAALARAAGQAATLARLERRTNAVAAVIGGVGSLVPGASALGVFALTVRGGPSVMVAVLPLLALATVEVVLPLTGAAVRYAELRGAWQRVRSLLATRDDARVDGAAVSGAVGPSGDAGPEGARGLPVPGVMVRGVAVRYPSAVAPALDGVDLELPPGRRVAVVGPSGAGKSTLLGVLTGGVRPTGGEVLVGGRAQPLGWPLSGGVLADGYVFHASVRENLTLGRAGFDDPALRRALTDAGLPDWVDRLDEQVGEDGAQVSGGQRQRLLLARALLDPPPLLVLDEPTEGLDPAAADAVLGDVLRVTAGRTVVLVTHRLVDLREFDEVVVLVGGRVAERGRHDTLRVGDGWYAQWAAVREIPESIVGTGVGR